MTCVPLSTSCTLTPKGQDLSWMSGARWRLTPCPPAQSLLSSLDLVPHKPSHSLSKTLQRSQPLPFRAGRKPHPGQFRLVPPTVRTSSSEAVIRKLTPSISWIRTLSCCQPQVTVQAPRSTPSSRTSHGYVIPSH